MANIKHNKYKNTGILFELLVRKITADTMSSHDSKAVSLIKKYFVNTELSRENKLYQSISKSQNISEAQAESILSTILEVNKTLDRTKLAKEKYNLIKEIKFNFDIEDFFKARVNNYIIHASIYKLFELLNDKYIQKFTILFSWCKIINSPRYIIQNEISIEKIRRLNKSNS
jgi:hypothetical protein